LKAIQLVGHIVLKLRRIADDAGNDRIDAAVEKDVWWQLSAWSIDTANAGLIGVSHHLGERAVSL
jgi:hypothetical protein